MQSIVDSCDCHASKQSDSRDRGHVSSLPIPYCANSLLYADFIHGLPKFGGYDSCLVVTCGQTRFTRAFPCNKKITGEQTVKILVQEWFEPYGAPKEIHSDKDVRIPSDTGWYKRVLDTLNVQVTTVVPYTHTSNPLFNTCQHLQVSCGSVLWYNLKVLGCEWLNATTHGLSFPHTHAHAHTHKHKAAFPGTYNTLSTPPNYTYSIFPHNDPPRPVAEAWVPTLSQF